MYHNLKFGFVVVIFALFNCFSGNIREGIGNTIWLNSNVSWETHQEDSLTDASNCKILFFSDSGDFKLIVSSLQKNDSTGIVSLPSTRIMVFTGKWKSKNDHVEVSYKNISSLPTNTEKRETIHNSLVTISSNESKRILFNNEEYERFSNWNESSLRRIKSFTKK